MVLLTVYFYAHTLFGTMSEQLMEEVCCVGWFEVLNILKRLVSSELKNEFCLQFLNNNSFSAMIHTSQN